MNSCNAGPVQSSCSFSCDRMQAIDPLMPVASTARPGPKNCRNSKLVARKSLPAKLPTKTRNKNCPKPVDPSENCFNKPRMNNNSHPSDCACAKCDECVSLQDIKDKKLQQAHDDACESEMANPRSERNMKNYLHDNPQLEPTKTKKSSSCANLMDCIGPNSEVWLLQCPKNFDPKTLMNTELGSLPKDKGCKVDLTTKCFNNKITLACLTPEKASEYEAVCDRVKMLRPVGKITVVQKGNLPRKSSTNKLPAPIKVEPCSEVEESCEDEDTDPCQNPITSKKVKTKINDQKFTIETTVTVENCSGDARKKNRKSKHDTCGECLPLVPPEPIVPKKKQKKNLNDDMDTSWLDC
ncbi:uncharacterized protein [Chironomus tepperi]|uniref:uncharacterized protein n=1 Tax=Chironomus tepperi TaxID=113505 RepID=UPI00391F69C3